MAGRAKASQRSPGYFLCHIFPQNILFTTMFCRYFKPQTFRKYKNIELSSHYVFFLSRRIRPREMTNKKYSLQRSLTILPRRPSRSHISRPHRPEKEATKSTPATQHSLHPPHVPLPRVVSSKAIKIHLL